MASLSPVLAPVIPRSALEKALYWSTSNLLPPKEPGSWVPGHHWKYNFSNGPFRVAKKGPRGPSPFDTALRVHFFKKSREEAQKCYLTQFNNFRIPQLLVAANGAHASRPQTHQQLPPKNPLHLPPPLGNTSSFLQRVPMLLEAGHQQITQPSLYPGYSYVPLVGPGVPRFGGYSPLGPWAPYQCQATPDAAGSRCITPSNHHAAHQIGPYATSHLEPYATYCVALAPTRRLDALPPVYPCPTRFLPPPKAEGGNTLLQHIPGQISVGYVEGNRGSPKDEQVLEQPMKLGPVNGDGPTTEIKPPNRPIQNEASTATALEVGQEAAASLNPQFLSRLSVVGIRILKIVSRQFMRRPPSQAVATKIECMGHESNEMENAPLGSLQLKELEKFVESSEHMLSDDRFLQLVISLSDHSLKLIALIYPQTAASIDLIRLQRFLYNKARSHTRGGAATVEQASLTMEQHDEDSTPLLKL